MPTTRARALNFNRVLAKSPTGISGLDEITGGGLPKGRPTLITGGAGCGKTLLSMEFLIHGAQQYDEPGLFVSFEENERELMQNVASLGFNPADLIKRKRLSIDFVRAERSEIEETGDYDLEGLFVRLGHAIGRIKATRVVLDTIEALFAALPNQTILRAELRRLFRWLKDRGVTAIVTAERGDGTLTRHGLEEYVSDCVILLDHRVIEQVSTRRLRVVKYRGSAHGTNEYPFLIDETGFSVLPITSLSLNHEAPTERMPTGIAQLDTMLGGQGLFRGGSVLISGTPGSGKTSIAAHVAAAACARGERCLYFLFEESQQQILRNMSSIGLDLRRWMTRGLLRYHAARPHLHGLEMHLAVMHKQITAFEPTVVAVDPVSNLMDIGTAAETKAMLTRLIDFLKSKGITAVFTSLTSETNNPETTEVGISSLMDTWLLVRNLESTGERNRGLYILKSRGMAHSNQIREFNLTDHGVELRTVYTGPAGVLTGTARMVQEAQDQAEQASRQNKIARKQRELASKRQALEAQVVALHAAYEADAGELEAAIEAGRRDETARDRLRGALDLLRSGTTGNGRDNEKKGGEHGRHRQRSESNNGRKEQRKAEAR
ncbi:MAG: circadian clock protein KaiC [Nitrospira sp.]|nr:circadian clock protein KaiC [Nitrospira sp.]MDR4462635.1 circadian clock protein KaiC [Nitrospira sp.]